MRPEVAAKLRQINRQFYEEVAAGFSESRQRPQPGFTQLLPWLPAPCRTVLDVGCGNGRFGHFLLTHDCDITYTGIDNSAGLLIRARALMPEAAFMRADITQPGFLAGLGQFDLVVCLAAMQHVPGRANRVALLAEMGAHLAENGRLFLSNWQFLDSERQRRKIQPWLRVGLAATDVEADDYLLSWQRQKTGLRYVCQIDAAETAAAAQDAGLSIVAQYRSDGREGDLSLYTVLARNGRLPS